MSKMSNESIRIKDDKYEKERDDRLTKRQLDLWVKGVSIHIRLSDGNQYCCVDYSCCNKALLAPYPIRKLYAGNKKTREELQKTFTHYFTQIMGYGYAGGGTTLDYHEWCETSHFTWLSRCLIKFWIWRRGFFA